MASKGLSGIGSRVTAAADALSEADQAATAAAFTPREEHNAIVQLDSVVLRESDLRKLRPDHARGLAHSISIIGLIQPLVIDSRGHLLAGEHRRTALGYLREVADDLEKAKGMFAAELAAGKLDVDDIERIATAWARGGYSRGVPVRRMPFTAEEDAGRAFMVEVAENTQRYDFTQEELVGVFTAFKAAGYRTEGGRPKKGEKAIMPALSLVFGRHVRNIRRMLNDESAGPEKKATPKTVVALKKIQKALKSFASDLPPDVRPSARTLLDEISEVLEKRGL